MPPVSAKYAQLEKKSQGPQCTEKKVEIEWKVLVITNMGTSVPGVQAGSVQNLCVNHSETRLLALRRNEE